MRNVFYGGLIVGLVMFVVMLQVQVEEIVIVVYVFLIILIYIKNFFDYVDKVNEVGKGVVQIEVCGGLEVIGMFQQLDVVCNGIVDMVYMLGLFYVGIILEKDVMVVSNLIVVDICENGGIVLMDQIYQEKMGVKYFGWFDSGVCYNLWICNVLEFDVDGNFKVEGLKLCGNVVYNVFFINYFGVQVIDLLIGEVYNVLQCGIVDVIGWIQIGLIDLKWNEFFNYCIELCFFFIDFGVIVNFDKWNSLSLEVQKVLQDVVIQYEKDIIVLFGFKCDVDFKVFEE